MKKKFLTTVAASAIVCAAAFTLFGCGGNEKPVTYTVTYEKGATDATGTAPATVSYAEGAEVTVAANPFTYTGYTFKEWSDGTATYKAGAKLTMPAKNVTLTAVWDPVSVTQTFTVVFMNGTETVASKTVNEGDAVELPDDPTAPQDKRFEGWYIKDTDTEVTEGYKPTKDITVEARYSDVYTVLFKDGDTVVRTAEVEKGDAIGRMPTTPADKADATFGGWYIKDSDPEVEVTAEYIPTASIEVVAKWNPKQQVTVTFKNGDTTVDTKTVYAGDTVTLPAAPEKTAFTFKGWQTPEGALFDATKPVTASVELNPIWEISFAGIWTSEDDTIGVEVLAKNDGNGVVGYAFTREGAMLLAIQETETGFALKPIGMSIGDTTVTVEYAETEATAEQDSKVTLTVKYFDKQGKEDEDMRTVYDTVEAITPSVLLNGTYTEAYPQDPDKIGSLEIRNGALTFTNLKEFDTANVLHFSMATVYYGELEAEEGQEDAGTFATYVVNARDAYGNLPADMADALMIMYRDTTIDPSDYMTSQVMLMKDLMKWGTTDAVSFHELKKGQSISYTAKITSAPTEAWHGILAQILADGIDGNSYFIRPDGHALLNPFIWDGADMTANWGTTPFNGDTYKAQANGATVNIVVSLALGGTLTVKVDFAGAAATDAYNYSVTYTAVAKTETAKVGFACENVTVTDNGYTAFPFNTYHVYYQIGYFELPEDTETEIPYSNTGITKITLPAAPTFEDETLIFKGWIYDGKTYEGGAEITLGDESYVMIEASIARKVTISFTCDDESAVGEMDDVEVELGLLHGTSYKAPACTITVPNATFMHWQTSHGVYNVGEDIPLYIEESTLTLTAVFASAESVYTVEFYKDIDGELVVSKTYDKDAGATLEIPTTTKEGWTFLGWFELTDNANEPYGARLNEENPPTVEANATYVAKWEQIKVTVTFKSEDGETTLASGEVVYGNTVASVMANLEAPTKQYYRFDGWFDGETPITETTIVSDQDITAIAGFTQVEAFPKGVQNPTADEPIEYGDSENNLAFTYLAPQWIGKIQKGEVVTLKGTMTSKGAGNHESVILYLFSGLEPTVFIRSDNFFDGTSMANGDVANDSKENWTMTKRPYLNWDTFVATMKNSDVAICFDWSSGNSILLTIEYHGKDNDITMHQCYYVSPVAGHALKDEYSIGLGGENCHVVIKEKTSESIAPAYSEQQENIAVGNEDCVFGYTWLNPAWVGNPISVGQRVVIEGTVKSAGSNGWEVPIAYLFSGKISGGALRLDGYNNSETYYGLNVASVAGISGADSNYRAEGAAAANADTEFLTAIQAGVNLTLTYDYTNSDKVVITAVFAWGEGDDAKSRTTTFTVTNENGTLPESFNIGLGGENMYFTATVTRTTNAD